MKENMKENYKSPEIAVLQLTTEQVIAVVSGADSSNAGSYIDIPESDQWF